MMAGNSTGTEPDAEKERRRYKRMFDEEAIAELAAGTKFDESQERAAMEWIAKIKNCELRSETDNLRQF